MNRSPSLPAARGFSLMELMLVVLILGILMTVVTYNLASSGEKAKTQATKTSLGTIKGALTSYHLEFSAYPPTLATLVQAKFVEDSGLVDGWKKPFIYDPRGTSDDRPYILGSMGKDGVAGNEDDIDVWTMSRPAQPQ